VFKELKNNSFVFILNDTDYFIIIKYLLFQSQVTILIIIKKNNNKVYGDKKLFLFYFSQILRT